MEYDRALYRVYERIMEDLNSSPSPLALTSNNAATVSSSPHSGLRRRYNRVDNQDDGDANNSNENDAEIIVDDDLESNNNANNGSASPGGSQQSRRGRRHTRAQQIHIIAQRRTQQQRREAVPFILPIWLSRKIDALHVSNNSNAGFVSQLWSNIMSRSILSLRGRGEDSYDSVATSPSHSSRLRPSTPEHDSNHRDETIDLESGGLELQTLTLSPTHSIERSDSYNEGLRRRSPTRRPSPNNSNNDSALFHNESRTTSTTLPSIPTHASSSNNQNSTTTSILQPRISSPPSTSNNEGSAAVTSLAQRAIQNQLRQNEQQRRRRRRNRRPQPDSTSSGDSDSASSSSNNNSVNSSSTSTSSSSSDESIQNNNTANSSNEGCSQKNLYIVMRLSFWVAMLNVFILISLHVTYVGPYAFHKQTRLLNNNVNELSSNGRSIGQRLRRSLALRNNAGVRGGGDNNSKDATKNSQLINCISYALNTRPYEERSTYFGLEKDDENSSSNDDSKRRNRYLTNNGGLEPIKSEGDSIDATNEGNSPLFGKDEILQIKILYGGKKCTGVRCSRVRKVVYPQVKEESGVNDDDDDDDAKESQNSTKSIVEDVMDSNGYDRHLKWGKHKTDNDNSNTTAEDELSSPTYWEKPHYRYAIDDALLYLDEQAALLHNITVVNVTVTERCLSTGKDDGR